MADKVYIPNLVINEISDSLIDHITDQVGNNLTVNPTNLAKLNEANAFTGLNTFTTLPQSDATPTDNKDLVTKKYVDNTANSKVSKTGPETIEGVKTFSSIPLCSQRPTNGSQLANKDYVDSVATGGDISNFAKLDAENIFTQPQTIPQVNTNGVYSANKLNVSSTVEVDINVQYGSNDYRQISMTDAYGIQITSTDDTHTAQVSASPSGAGVVFNDRAIAIDNNGSNNSNRILISHTPTIITPTEWATMADNEVPTKKQILDNVQGGTTDTTNLAKLDSGNTFTGTQTFNGMVSFNQEVSLGDVKFYGNNNFYSNSIFGGPVVVTNQQSNQDFSIGPALNGVSINLGDNCTLQMNAKAISEFKRLLGIQ